MVCCSEPVKLGRPKNIPCKYFDVTLYKKGSMHIKFRNQALVDRFSIYCCGKKNWLPPNYGKTAYKDMTAEERTVVDGFHGDRSNGAGETSYREVMAKPACYLAEPTKDIYAHGPGNIGTKSRIKGGFLMRTRNIQTAEPFGILERCKAFETDLLKIKDIVPDKSDDGIPFNLSGFLSSIYQVIIVPQYDIQVDRDDYWEAREQLRESVVALAEKYDLCPSGDRIKDQGTHFCFVPRCGKSWKETDL